MAYFKFLRFKIRRKVRQEEGGECGLAKTHVLNRLVSDPPPCSGDLVKKFTREEIEKIAMNFSNVIGEGGFSTVFLACFSDSSLGALKIHRNSERLFRVFKQELEVLMRIRHENIVKLLGYCDERGGLHIKLQQFFLFGWELYVYFVLL